MAKPLHPQDEIVRTNLARFREEAGYSQAQAADLSGVPLDAIRRYENGVTATIPGTVLSALGRVYGHSVDDFFKTDPPPAKMDVSDVFFLKTRPGAHIDEDIYRKLMAVLDEANEQQRERETKPAKPRRGR